MRTIFSCPRFVTFDNGVFFRRDSASTLFGFLGEVIDWLSSADKATFLERERSMLIVIAAVVLLALPLMALLAGLLQHQTIIGH